MGRLIRFGRRQSTRLHSLSRRQATGLGVMAVLCAGVAITAVAGLAAVATSLLAVLLAAALAGVVHLSRRVGGLHRANQAALGDLRVVVEQVQRRLMAAVEKERLAAGDRHTEVVDALARAERLAGQGPSLAREQNREIQAAIQLFQAVAARAPMPVHDHRADLLGLVHAIRQRRPELAVALGVGPVAVWLGYAAETAGGRLVAVEHEYESAERIRDSLREHDLKTVEVVHAPMTDLAVDGRTVDWYDVDVLDALHDIDLLIVGGAPDTLPAAMHVLGRRLTPSAPVLSA